LLQKLMGELKMNLLQGFLAEPSSHVFRRRTAAVLFGIGLTLSVSPVNAQTGVNVLSDGTPILVQTSGTTSILKNGCGISITVNDPTFSSYPLAPAAPPPPALLGCGVGKVTFNSQLSSVTARAVQNNTAAMQKRMEDLREKRRRCRPGEPCPAGNALSYAPKSGDAEGQQKIGMALKAKEESSTSVEWSVWGNGDYDYEKRTGSQLGIDTGLKTVTVTGYGGIDLSIYGLLSENDGLSMGVYGSSMTSKATDNIGDTTRQKGPGVGAYFQYTDGAFTSNFSTTAAFFDETSSAMPATVGVNTYEQALNLFYKFKIGATVWWYEPTAGMSFTSTVYNELGHSFGLTDGHTVRLQAGVRYGADFAYGSVTVTPRLTALVYSDVLDDDGDQLFNVLTPVIPTDQGKVFGLIQSRLSVDWGNGFSGYMEGEARGRQDVLGLAARLGFNYVFANSAK
jgi:hypothetical protein